MEITIEMLDEYGIIPETNCGGFWFKFNRKRDDWRVYYKGKLLRRIKTECELINVLNDCV